MATRKSTRIVALALLKNSRGGDSAAPSSGLGVVASAPDDAFPSNATVRRTNVTSARSPYLNKRSKQCDGLSVAQCLKLVYKNASGEKARYTLSDLKYDIHNHRLEMGGPVSEHGKAYDAIKKKAGAGAAVKKKKAGAAVKKQKAGAAVNPQKLPESLPRGRRYLAGPKGVVVGVDEAGRGPWAGPVVAAAVAVAPGVRGLDRGVTDSKLLNEPRREWVYEALVNNPKVRYSVAIIGCKRIDKINILQATFEAMSEAVSGLGEKHVGKVLIDGNKVPPQLSTLPCEAVVKGDGKCFTIAAASIIAKVTRDRLLAELDMKYPKYGFKQHKGYGVKAHHQALKKHGLTPAHRRSYEPIKSFLENGHW